MNTIIIGQNGSGVTENVKERIEELQSNNETVVILDFKNELKDIGDITIVLDNINPLLSPLGIKDMKVLNAGYEKKSHFLYKKAEELLKEYHSFEKEYEGLKFEDIKNEVKRMRLLEETIERLSYSHENVERAWGEVFIENVPQRKLSKHIPIEKVLDVLEGKKIIRLTKIKNIQANHLRAITFFLLHRLSEVSESRFHVVADEMTNLLSKGNTKLFIDSLNKEKVKFVVSFNKTSDVPEEFYPIAGKFYIHKLQDKQEIKRLESLGIEIEEKIKEINKNEYIEIEKGVVV